MKIGRRHVQLERLLQRRPVGRQIDRDDRKAHIGARQHADCGQRDRAVPRRVLRHDRAAIGIAQSHAFGRRALDDDLVLERLERLPLALVPIALGVTLVGAQDEQVGLINVEIGAAKGEAVGMPLHDPGQPRRARADDVEPRRRHMDHVARAGAADAQMRIIGQDRSPGRTARRRYSPRIAAQRETVALGLGIERHFLDRIERDRAGGGIQYAQIGLAHRCDVEPFGNRERPGRPQRRRQLFGVEQTARLKLRAAHLVVSVAHAEAAAPH